MFVLSDAQFWGIVLACLMMCADVLTGFIVAVINNEVSSTAMREGLLRLITS